MGENTNKGSGGDQVVEGRAGPTSRIEVAPARCAEETRPAALDVRRRRGKSRWAAGAGTRPRAHRFLAPQFRFKLMPPDGLKMPPDTPPTGFLVEPQTTTW